jgi:hypothetical protein
VSGTNAARAARRAARRLLPARVVVGVAVLVLLVAFACVPTLKAHGELLLQLGAERVQPGGALEVRGDLGTGEAFEVALIAKADGSRRVIATIAAIEEGHFQTYVTVPGDVVPGDYLVEVAVDLSVVRAPLTVFGSPITGEEGGGPDRGEGLVQPMPSGVSKAVGGGADSGVIGGSGGPPADGDAISSRAGRSPLDGAVVLGVAAVIAAGLLVGMRLIGRRRRAP